MISSYLKKAVRDWRRESGLSEGEENIRPRLFRPACGASSTSARPGGAVIAMVS